MNIQVGDRVTYKYLNTEDKRECIAVIQDIVELEDYKRMIENKSELCSIEILKIECPKWEVVEENKELLTEEERNFLKNYMKLIHFENDIEYIEKMDNHIIALYLQDKCDFRFEITIENFVNLENYKKYTLSELGLEE